MLCVGVTLLIAMAPQDPATGFDGFPVSLLLLSGSFIFISFLGIAFAATVPTSPLMESDATVTWVSCCVAASAHVGLQNPSSPLPRNTGHS